MPNTALFVIDIQNGLARSATEIPHAARIRQTTEILLERVRGQSSSENEVELFFVQHEETPSSGDLVYGTGPWELVYTPREGETLVNKNTCSTFESNPDLVNQLRTKEIQTIVTCGIQSEWCVRETSLAALSAGFKVVVLQGAHSTYDDSESKKIAAQIERDVEEELKAQGAILTPWEEWLA